MKNINNKGLAITTALAVSVSGLVVPQVANSETLNSEITQELENSLTSDSLIENTQIVETQEEADTDDVVSSEQSDNAIETASETNEETTSDVVIETSATEPVVESDTSVVETPSVVESDTSVVETPSVVESDTSVVETPSVVESDTSVVETPSVVESDTSVVETPSVVESDTSVVESDTSVVESDTSVVESDTSVVKEPLLNNTTSIVENNTPKRISTYSGNTINTKVEQSTTPTIDKKVVKTQPRVADSLSSRSSRSSITENKVFQFFFMPITFWSGVFNKDKKEDKRTNDNVTYVTSTTTIRPTVTQNPSTTKGANITTTKNNPNSTTSTSSSPTRETVPTTLTQINWADFIGINDKPEETPKKTSEGKGFVDEKDYTPIDPNRPDLIITKDKNGNEVEIWTKDGIEYTATKVMKPGGRGYTRTIEQREVPGNKPGATYSINEKGETVETWVENGKRHVKTYESDGSVSTVVSDVDPAGWTRTWRDNGTEYVEHYDGYGKLLKTDKRIVGTPTPTSKPVDPTESRPWDVSTRSHYTPQELQGEAYRRYNDWNSYRQSKGLNPGVWDEQFANEAQKWADKLAQDDNGTAKLYSVTPHERQYVLSGQDQAYNKNYVRLYGGENVWMTDAYNVQDALNQFINSPGHNRNLLLQEQPGQPLHMGIGIAKGTGKDWNGRTPYYIVYKMR